MAQFIHLFDEPEAASGDEIMARAERFELPTLRFEA